MPDFDGPELLFGRSKYANKEEILTAIPARSIVDRRLAEYFGALDTAPGIVFSCWVRCLEAELNSDYSQPNLSKGGK